MTLDEVIERLEKAIESCLEIEKQLEKDGSVSALMYAENESQRADEYRQLAEWLKELKAYRETYPYGTAEYPIWQRLDR